MALPPESVAVPICVELSKNATVPAGTPPAELTCAVKVAVFPKLTCEALDISDVEVDAGVTVKLAVDDTDPAKLESPE